jgi:hypothetical protein
MNPQEFFRQAQFMRDYTPTVTPKAGTTINSLVVSYARFLVLGNLVQGMVGVTFNISNTLSPYLVISLPTLVATTSTAIFMGDAESGSFAYGANLVQTDNQNNVRIKKSNGNNFGIDTVNFPVVRLVGFFCYENGENN